MAEEVFALSPISARAALPSEADYDAIRDAFMETSRGRWFLGEYAKRNRNADTGMVLDAVARIEQTLAAQRQAQEASDKSSLEEALAAIRTAVDRAAETASAAVADMGVEEKLAPIRKGIRIIREISWRWREIGADGRICDLIDSQADAIEAGCGRISELDPAAALNAAFDLLKASVGGLEDDGTPATAVAPEPPQAEETMTAAPAASAEPDAAEMAMSPAEPTEMTAEAADAHDEAILDAIAIEMAAPDPEEPPLPSPDGLPATAEITPPPAVEPIAEAESFAPAGVPEPVAAPVPELQPSLPQEPPPPPSTALLEAPPSSETPPSPSPEPSLGSMILATGLLQRPKTSAGDPLAPIRRMSQAEKIAFFS